MTVAGSSRDTRHSAATGPLPGARPLRRVELDSLAGSLARVARLQHRFELHTDLAGDGWQRCSDLLAGPVLLGEWAGRLGHWLREHYGEADARTTAGYLMSWYLRVPAYVGALLLHHERRVPALRPEELAVRTAPEGRPDPVGVAVLGGSFYCLPYDPGAMRPEATAVADERALAAMLRARYTAHAARFVRTYSRISPLGTRMLWAGATDALDTCLWWAGLDGGDEGAGVADAALVLDSPYPPLTAASTLRMDEDQHGRRGWARRRESCCFTYLVPGRVECEACPRRCPKGS